MIHLKNKKIIARLAKKSIRANRMRSLFTIIAIVLTTLLITAVCAVGFSLNQTIERAAMKTVGGDYHGVFKYVTSEEAAILADHPLIKKSGRSVTVGDIEDERLIGHSVELKQIDESMQEHWFIHLIDGHLPMEENEIVLNTWTLDLLDVPHKVGEKVSLTLNINNKIISKEFKVAGYYEADQYVAMAGLGFVSPAFVEQHLSHINPIKSREDGTYTNTINLEVMFQNAWNIEEKMQKVIEDTSIQAAYGVNWAYSTVSLDRNLTALLPFLLLIVITMLSGYLLIYNIFYISVVRDIRFYGLFKTIGTSPKQLKSLITMQANRLFIVALPIGWAFGYAVSLWITPKMTTMMQAGTEAVYSTSPLIFIIAALFAYITVRIAASKPGRLVAKVSPIDAVRFSGVMVDGKKKMKRTKNGAKLMTMAFRHLFRQKKKWILMLLSLSLSVLLFSVIYLVISSINVNSYLNSFITGDFVITDNDSSKNVDEVVLDEKMKNSLASMDGVNRIEVVYYNEQLVPLNQKMQTVIQSNAAKESEQSTVFKDTLKRGKVRMDLYGISEGWFDLISEKDVVAGSLHRAKWATGDYIIVSQSHFGKERKNYYKPGDHVTIPETGKSYEVLAVVTLDTLYAAGNKSYAPAGFYAYLPTTEKSSMGEYTNILSMTLHVKEQAFSQVKQTLDAIAEDAHVIVKSRADYQEELHGFVRLFKTIGYGLSFIIALIGLLNYINTMLTSVFARRREFAMMESVGMTKKQVRKLLLFEGLSSIVLSSVFIFTIGLGLIYVMAKGVAELMMFTAFEMKIWPTLIVMSIFTCTAIVVTLFAYQSLTKKTIVERLRESE